MVHGFRKEKMQSTCACNGLRWGGKIVNIKLRKFCASERKKMPLFSSVETLAYLAL